MLFGWWILCFCYYSKTFGLLSHIWYCRWCEKKWYCRMLWLISPGTYAFKVPYNERYAFFLLHLGCILFLSIFFWNSCAWIGIPLFWTISFYFRMISSQIFFGFMTKVIKVMPKQAWYWWSPVSLYVNRLLNQGLIKQLRKSTMLHGWKL